MFTIIGGDGKEYGPVSTEQIRAWIAAGRANLDTKAKVVGTDAWQRLGDFVEFNGSAVLPGVPPMGATPTPVRAAGPIDIAAYANDLSSRSGPLDMGDAIGAAFKLWTSNFFPLVGVTFLILLIQLILGLIPFLGTLSRLLLTGVFLGGLYYYYLGKYRGEPRQLGDAFAGFSKAFVQLMLAGLVSGLLLGAILFVCMLPLFPFFFQMSKQMQAGNFDFSGLPQLGALAVGAIFVGGIIAVYLTVSWSMTYALVIDQGLNFWSALEVSRRVVGRQWFRVFIVQLVIGFITCLGLLLLLVGVIFTLPLPLAANTAIYERLCNPPPKV